VFKFVRSFFAENLRLKTIALILALALWFYIVGELNKGSEEERQLLNKVLPSEGVTAKKLVIKPIIIGTPRRGYTVNAGKVVVIPSYCIVIGTRELLGRVKYAYTMPVDVKGVYKSFINSVSLNPIAPGVYMEETLVQVTVPIEKAN